MRAVEANALRAAILRLYQAGLTPREIARKVGCDRTTVYKVLRRPEPDRRATRRRRRATLPPGLARLEAVLAEYARGGWAGTGAPGADAGDGAMGGAGRGDGAAGGADGDDGKEAPDPYADVAGAGYLLARADGTVEPEAALLRMLLRHTLRELSEDEQDPGARTPAERARLRRVAAELVRAFARVRSAGDSGAQMAAFFEYLRTSIGRAPTEVTGGGG